MIPEYDFQVLKLTQEFYNKYTNPPYVEIEIMIPEYDFQVLKLTQGIYNK